LRANSQRSLNGVPRLSPGLILASPPSRSRYPLLTAGFYLGTLIPQWVGVAEKDGKYEPARLLASALAW
jgi:hypothetical protein